MSLERGSIEGESDDDSECPCCYKPLTEVNSFAQPCGHTMCNICRLKIHYKNENEDCPMCRAPLGTELPPPPPTVRCTAVVDHISIDEASGWVRIEAPKMKYLQRIYVRSGSFENKSMPEVDRKISFILKQTWNKDLGHYVGKARNCIVFDDENEYNKQGIQAFKEYREANIEIFDADVWAFSFVGQILSRSIHSDFGFISIDAGFSPLESVFVHFSKCVGGEVPPEKTRVAFDIVPSTVEEHEDKLQASRCTIISNKDYADFVSWFKKKQEKSRQENQRKEEEERAALAVQQEAAAAIKKAERLAVKKVEDERLAAEAADELRRSSALFSATEVESLDVEQLCFYMSLSHNRNEDIDLLRKDLKTSMVEKIRTLPVDTVKDMLRVGQVDLKTIKRTKDNAAEKLTQAVLKLYGY